MLPLHTTTVCAQWALEGRIGYMIARGKTTVADIHALNGAANTMFETGIAPVHIIVDLSRLGRPVLDFEAILSDFRMEFSSKTGTVVLVKANHVLMLMLNLLFRLINHRLHAADTLQGALDYLYAADPTLPTPRLTPDELRATTCGCVLHAVTNGHPG
jgi:hypothetical protein